MQTNVASEKCVGGGWLTLVESSCCTIHLYLSVTSSPWSRTAECTRRGESVTGCDPLTAPPWKVTLSANHDYIKCHSLSLSLSPSLFFSLSCPRSKLLYITVSFKFPSKFLGACLLIHFIVSITAMCWERKMNSYLSKFSGKRRFTLIAYFKFAFVSKSMQRLFLIW